MPDKVCTDCYQGDSFLCSLTAQLRLAQNITKPVVREPEPDQPVPTDDPVTTVTDPPPDATPPLDVDPPMSALEDISIREELLSSSPEELADIILSLRADRHKS